MSKKRLITTVGGTAACALGIGFFMQQAGNAPHPQDIQRPAPIQKVSLEPQAPVDEKPLDVTEIELTSAEPDEVNPDLQTAGLLVAPLGELTLPAAPEDPDTPKLGCNISAVATAAAMAHVNLAVSSPCFGNERITIHHNGMMFTETTDIDGQLNVSVPALSKNAVFVISFPNGTGTVAMARVPSLAEFDRVVVQWSGDTGFQVHAREFGAGYGDAGHVWSGSDHHDAASGGINGGFLTRLGDADTLAPRMAEVYTYPTLVSEKSGTVALSVEAEVTAANCGRDISAQSLELRGDQTLRTRDLVLSMPNCSATGDFLVLNNLVDDLKIAAK